MDCGWCKTTYQRAKDPLTGDSEAVHETMIGRKSCEIQR